MKRKYLVEINIFIEKGNKKEKKFIIKTKANKKNKYKKIKET